MSSSNISISKSNSSCSSCSSSSGTEAYYRGSSKLSIKPLGPL